MQSSSLLTTLLLSFYVLCGARALPAALNARNATARILARQNGLTMPLEWGGLGTVPSVTLQIGSDPNPAVSRTFNMIADTGSTSFWVLSQAAVTNYPHLHGLGTTSPDYTQIGGTWITPYGNGLTVQGFVAEDSVSFAGRPNAVMHLGVANQPGIFRAYGFDGVFGFATGDPTVPDAPAPFAALAANAAEQIPQITGWKYPNTAAGQGQITLGWVNPANSVPGTEVVFYDTDPHFWRIVVHGIAVNNDNVHMPFGPITAILDTGTATLVTPVAESIYLLALIPGFNVIAWTIPCDSNAVVSFGIGDKIFPIWASDLASDHRDPPGSNNCAPLVMEAANPGIGPGTWFFGSAVLHNWHIILDERNGPENKLISVSQASQ